MVGTFPGDSHPLTLLERWSSPPPCKSRYSRFKRRLEDRKICSQALVLGIGRKQVISHEEGKPWEFWARKG